MKNHTDVSNDEAEFQNVVDSVFNEILDEYVDQIYQTTKYRKSIVFDCDFLEIKQWLYDYASFSTDGVWYTEDEETIKRDKQAIKIADTLAQTDKHSWKRTADCGFLDMCCVYDGVRICMTFGQGTLYSFSLVKE